MEVPACTFQLDHGGSVIRIIGNRSGLQKLVEELTACVNRYADGEAIPLVNDALCIYQGGTDVVEYVCDDAIKSESKS